MPKIRSRNVNSLPNNEFLPFPPLNLPNNQPFGEQVEPVEDLADYSNTCPSKTIKFCSQSDSSDLDSFTLELNKLGGLSSSSSLSWSDEYYEKESSKKVYDELKRIDRVLRREEGVPSWYDEDEFELWMKYFPNLTIFDSEATPVNSVTNLTENFNDDLLICKCCCDKSTCDTKEDKSAVINNNIDNSMSQKLLNLRSPNLHRRKNHTDEVPQLFFVSNKPRVLDTDKYLKISSLQGKFCERKPSSRSLMSRQISREFNEEFNSLPFLINEDIPVQTKEFTVRKEKKIDKLVLPPIIINDQFRSVSALPRQNKSLSALSMNIKAVEFKRKCSKEFLQNPIGSRTDRGDSLL